MKVGSLRHPGEPVACWCLMVLAQSLRPPFLLLTLSVVLLAAALARYEGATFSVALWGLLLVAALAAHGAVNLLNEYGDWRSGLDAKTVRTPFSGGSGALVRCPACAPWVEAVGWGLLGLTGTLGLFFVWLTGAWLLALFGVVGLWLVVAYTPWITRRPGWSLIAPGLAFGPIMVVGVHFVLTGTWSPRALLVSLTPFFLVNNLLLLNQLPDLDADRQVGRRNLHMVAGVPVALRVYEVFLLMALALPLMLAVLGLVPPAMVWVALGGLVLSVPIGLGLRRLLAGRRAALLPVLTLNVLLAVLTPAAMAWVFWLYAP